MSAKKYSEQWLDPRWQKRRLEIMQRDSFQCSECGADDKTLNVHHVYYTRGADVWDYPGHALKTLCNECHEAEHSIADISERALIDALKHVGIMSSQIGAIAFSIEQLHAHVGNEKAKRLIEIIDLFLFRPVIDEASIGKIEALYQELLPKNCGFEKRDSE